MSGGYYLGVCPDCDTATAVLVAERGLDDEVMADFAREITASGRALVYSTERPAQFGGPCCPGGLARAQAAADRMEADRL